MRALDGRLIAVTRARQQQDGLGTLLAELGAEVIFCPAIEIVPPLDWAPLDTALQSLPTYDWIVFTSRNAVEQFHSRLAARGVDQATVSPVRVAAVGPATRDALRDRGIRVDTVPETALADAIPDLLGNVQDLRILLPRSDIARPELPAVLRAKGAIVDDVVAYRTISSDAAALVDRVRGGGVDAITFASASAVSSFVNAARDVLDDVSWHSSDRPRTVAIGPLTARAAAELDFPVDAVAAEHDNKGLVRAVVECLSKQPVKTP